MRTALLRRGARWGAVLLAACAVGPPNAAAAGTILRPLSDAVSYAADLTASDGGHSWSGTEQIVVRNAGSTAVDRVWLRLWGNGATGCTGPRAVTATVTGGGSGGRLLRRCTALEVLLPAPLASHATTTLTLALTITAPNLADRFGITNDIALYGNALPVVAQRDRSGWRLPPYSAYGESWVTTWARFSLLLHHPADLQVVAAGTTTTAADANGTTATTTSVVEARDTFWAIGSLGETTRRTKRGVLVRAWSPQGSGTSRIRAARDAAGALDQIERHLPNYPYDEYDVLVAPIQAGGGMEYPTVVITDGSETVTRHETGHQWFYGLVGDDQYREPWIDEGFTTFLETYWSSATAQPRPHCYPARRFAVSDPTTFITSSMRYWNAHVGEYSLAYANPACALQEARRRLGNARFTAIMRGLVTTYGRGTMTGADVRAAFGTSLRDLWPRWGLAAGR
ncbi:MAG: M1 family aminopeptidase [Patulibacter sp.]